MFMRQILAIAGLIAVIQVVSLDVSAAPGGNGNGNGKGFGKGKGGGGAPLPALGLTLLGQVVGAGGIYVMWRPRRKS